MSKKPPNAAEMPLNATVVQPNATPTASNAVLTIVEVLLTDFQRSQLLPNAFEALQDVIFNPIRSAPDTNIAGRLGDHHCCQFNGVGALCLMRKLKLALFRI